MAKREGIGRRLVAALADSTPAFQRSRSEEGRTLWRRLLSALTDSSAAFHGGQNTDEFVGRPSPPTDDERRATTSVFISYAHDSENHARHVRQLAESLSELGIHVWLDQWQDQSRTDWTSWMRESMQAADVVVVVGSPTYGRANPEVTPASNRAFQYELSVLRELTTEVREDTAPKVIPVIIPGGSSADVPSFLPPPLRVKALDQKGIAPLVADLQN